MIGTLLLLLIKTYLLIKVTVWVYFRITYPELHPIQEIDWVLVLLILDTWLVSHTKIEISGIIKKSEN
jgi:hypothetical protein